MDMTESIDSTPPNVAFHHKMRHAAPIASYMSSDWRSNTYMYIVTLHVDVHVYFHMLFKFLYTYMHCLCGSKYIHVLIKKTVNLFCILSLVDILIIKLSVALMTFMYIFYHLPLEMLSNLAVPLLTHSILMCKWGFWLYKLYFILCTGQYWPH